MRCRFCDSELPRQALFCGECGRAASTASAGTVSAAHPIVDRPLTVAAPPPEPGVSVPTGAMGVIPDACEQCGSSLATTDFFCGECGFVRAPDSAGRGAGPTAESVDSAGRASAKPRTDSPPSHHADEAESAPRFVLQFSTGESATVSGSGLIGRSPRPEPGEFFDDLVTVSDPSRSVSKTHLEFGHEGGEFWIKDRFSGNGTVLRAPDAPVVQLVADRRYRVPRGSRVDVGEQFFVVS